MSIIAQIKDKLLIKEYYWKKGLAFPNVEDDKEVQFSCQIHGKDTHPSARYYPKTRTMKCHACGFFGDVLTVIKLLEGFQNIRQVIDYVIIQFPEKNISMTDEDYKSEEITTSTKWGSLYTERNKKDIIEYFGNRLWERIDETGDYTLLKKFESYRTDMKAIEDLNLLLTEFKNLMGIE